MPVCRATKLSNSSQISSGCCTGKTLEGSHKAELIRKAQAVRTPATLRDFHLVCPGQGQVADQLGFETERSWPGVYNNVRLARR